MHKGHCGAVLKRGGPDSGIACSRTDDGSLSLQEYCTVTGSVSLSLKKHVRIVNERNSCFKLRPFGGRFFVRYRVC